MMEECEEWVWHLSERIHASIPYDLVLLHDTRQRHCIMLVQQDQERDGIDNWVYLEMNREAKESTGAIKVCSFLEHEIERTKDHAAKQTFGISAS